MHIAADFHQAAEVPIPLRQSPGVVRLSLRISAAPSRQWWSVNGFSRQKMLTTGESTVLLRAREATCRRLALLSSALTGAAALAVLLGWTLDSEALERLGLGTVIMIPPTA